MPTRLISPPPPPKPISRAAFSLAPGHLKRRNMAQPIRNLYSFRRDDSSLLGYPRPRIFYFDAFSSREPVPTSLENALAGAATLMSRRTRKPLPKRNAGDRPKGERPFRGNEGRPQGHRPGNKPAKRLGASAPRASKPASSAAQPRDEQK